MSSADRSTAAATVNDRPTARARAELRHRVSISGFSLGGTRTTRDAASWQPTLTTGHCSVVFAIRYLDFDAGTRNWPRSSTRRTLCARRPLATPSSSSELVAAGGPRLL